MKEKHPALLCGSTAIVGIENNSWAAKTAAEFREKELTRKKTEIQYHAESLNLLVSAMSEMRRTARLLQCVAVGGKINLDHFQIKGNDDKADDIEKLLRATPEVLKSLGFEDNE
jgi:hypothetical protein